MKHLILITAAIIIASCTKEETFRDENQFIHFSQVYANDLLPESLENKYDSILWSKNIGSFKEDSRGIIYEAEVISDSKDTIWTAFVVVAELGGDCIASVEAEGVSVDEAATTLIKNLEFYLTN